jgi:glycerol-3-phosphate acyltransferase PlsX
MDEEPSRMVMRKRDSSLVRAVQAVADGQATAVVSAGNSGAALVAGTLILGRTEGVERPALGMMLPVRNGHLFCADLGGTTDCKPEYLEQFALMGHVYMKQRLGIARPRIALLSNGHEPYKGSSAVKKAYTLLEQRTDITFIGNLEARDIFQGNTDVLVCDGFTGNIMLKTAQGTMREMFTRIKEEINRSFFYKLIFFFGQGIFNRFKTDYNYRDQGYAPMLGLRHLLLVAHGCSSELAIESALIAADNMVREKFLATYNSELTARITAHNHASLHSDSDAAHTF